MRPRVRAKQRTGTGRQGRHDHTFARVFGEGPRSMVLPTVRPVSGAGVRCKGGAAAFEERVPRGAVASTPVQQEATSIRRFRAAACGFPRLGFEKLDVASCGQRQAYGTCRARKASAQAARYAAGAVNWADCNPKPPNVPGRAARSRTCTDGEAIELLAEACTLLAQARAPKHSPWPDMARFTALRDG